MTDTLATPRRLGWVVGLTSTAYFMVVLDSVVVITALPRMQRDLHVSLSSLQWTLNAYGIAFAAGIITAAALGDRFGRRKVFSIGLARHYSPVGAGVRLLPFFATPMCVSPLAGALSDRIGRRPIIVAGLSLLTAGFVWVAWRGTLHTSWIELVVALLVAGVGISMALPTVPTAVLSAVAPHEMGKASGINYMAQRFGAVFAVAIGSAVFATYGGLGSPAAVTAGFKPGLWACSVLAGLGVLAALAMSPRPKRASELEPESVPIAA